MAGASAPAAGQTPPDPARPAADPDDPHGAGQWAGESAIAHEDTVEASGGRLIYVPSDFAAFAPRNALDLIERIPGFDVPRGGSGGGGGGGGGRGFGEASGNLLINGERLTSKSISLRDQLSRIPVSNVIRIEVVDGATLNVPGLSGRVANIIARTGSLSGQFSWNPQWTTGVAPFLWSDARISVRGSAGGVEYTLALSGNGFSRGSDGITVFRDAAGIPDPRYNIGTATFSRPTFAGNFTFRPAAGVTANLNVTAGLQIFRNRESENRLPDNPLPSFDEQIRTWNNEHFYEIGGDIEFPLAGGRLKLIALESFEHGNFRTQSLVWVGGDDPFGTRFERLQDSGERIARAEYSWAMLGADWQVSAEGAFNRLDQVGTLLRYSAPEAAFVAVPFPGGVGGVREERFESILSVGFPVTSRLNLQLAAGGEYSTISQTGANALSRRFQRPKGTLNLAWSAPGSVDVNLSLARRVGQLSFGDFLASVNLSQDNENAGNNQLRPQQSWETELQLARQFGAVGSATLRLFDHRIDDLVLIVPVPGGEARGNIGSATRRGLQFNGTLQLDSLGWAGARLDTRVTAETSRLIDPTTGTPRRFDGLSPFEVRLDFRHDVPATPWAWGTEFRHTENAFTYRVREIFLEHNPSTFGAIFVEHKDLFGLTVRARIGNLFNGKNVYRRVLHSGRRDETPILLTEDRALTIGRVFQLSITGSF